jgi:branched-chain amino acid transport system ATP-binding protein
LLIDELSLGLAPTVTGELLDVVEQVVEFGTTILLVEQSIGVALAVADTVSFMDRGVIEPLGDADSLDADRLTRRLLEGRT